jgi:hypothetical protein
MHACTAAFMQLCARVSRVSASIKCGLARTGQSAYGCSQRGPECRPRLRGWQGEPDDEVIREGRGV